MSSSPKIKILKNIEKFDDIPIYMLPSILDELDLKSLVNICTLNKNLIKVCNNDIYKNKIKKYKRFMIDVKNVDEHKLTPEELNIKYGGDIDLLIIMKEQKLLQRIGGAEDYLGVIIGATRAGNNEAIKMILKWIEQKGLFSSEIFIKEGLKHASCYGQIKTMKFLINQGATNFYESFEAASRCGQTEAMKLLKQYTK